MNMNCEVIDESGPAHRKTFVTECKIGDLTTKGEAKSKKESKRVASEEMLQRLDELPPISKDMQIKSLMNMSNKKKNKKKKNVIKNSFEEISLKIQSSLKSTFQINDDQGSNEKVTKKLLNDNFFNAIHNFRMLLIVMMVPLNRKKKENQNLVINFRMKY